MMPLPPAAIQLRLCTSFAHYAPIRPDRQVLNDFGDAATQAVGLIAAGDPQLVDIVLLSLRVSLTSVVLRSADRAAARRARRRRALPRARRRLIVVLNALMGLPSVVVGLVVYLLLSRAGPLGSWGILFTPTAMVIAQTILITPTMAALSRQIDRGRLGRIPRAAALARRHAARRRADAAVGPALLARSRSCSAGSAAPPREVGAVMIVGGNIDGVTRVMTTAIALETSKGDLPLALGLGIILLAIVLALNAAAYVVRDAARRRYG